MPEEQAAHHAKGLAGGIGHFFSQTTAGLPNWAWLLVIGGGIAAAIIVPKLFGQQATTTGTDTSGTSTDNTSGAVPTYDTGVGGGGGYSGYDYSGQVAAAPAPTTTAQAGTDTSQQSSTSQLNQQNATPGTTNFVGTGPTLNPWVPATTPAPGEPWYQAYQNAGEPFGTQPTPQISGGKYQQAKYVTVGSWPSKQLGWAAIASKYRTTVKRLEQLNPSIPGLSQGGHGSAHPGETIRVA